MGNKQTAVEWLWNAIIHQKAPMYSEILEAAKQMEKEQAERMYSEEEVIKILLKHQSDYRSFVRKTSPLNWSFDIIKWFEQFKKK